MDLTSLAMLLTLLASAIGVDTVLHPTSVVLEANVAGKLDKLTIDTEVLNTMLTYEVTQICSTPTLLASPEVRTGANVGVGMAVAQALKMQSVALALQAQLGNEPERIRLILLGEDNAVKALVSGSGIGGHIRTPPFQEMLLLQPNETLASLVHRAALAGMKKIDPYVTSLYLVQSHIADRDFSEAEALVNEFMTNLPQTPVNSDRSELENLLGMMSLFRNDTDKAREWFHKAMASDPDNGTAALNDTFVDVQISQYGPSAKRLEALLTTHPPSNKTLLSTGYLIWAAALLGLYDADAAEDKVARAVAINPSSSQAYYVWSEIKEARGDTEGAKKLKTQAWDAAATFDLYTEVAALYFDLSLKPGQPLTRNPFNNPATIRYN